jgi:hypothetical protein
MSNGNPCCVSDFALVPQESGNRNRPPSANRETTSHRCGSNNQIGRCQIPEVKIPPHASSKLAMLLSIVPAADSILPSASRPSLYLPPSKRSIQAETKQEVARTSNLG